MKNAVLKGRMEEPSRIDTESILLGLKLIHEGKLLNAALALYGKNEKIYPIYPQFSIRLARFRGKDRLADFLDSRTFSGHAFSLLRRGESFLRDHIPIAGKVLSERMIREDYPMYPYRALREAIANAICHRDYASSSGAVTIAMYDDHLEISNPGMLQFGFTSEHLAKPHASKPWNPMIAEVFYRSGIIEQWGTGTLNIIKWCKENQNLIPSWDLQPQSVVVTFFANPLFSTQVTGQVTGQVALLEFCKEARTAKEITEWLGLKNRESFYKLHLKPLIEKGLLLKTIPNKPNSRKQQYFTNSTKI